MYSTPSIISVTCTGVLMFTSTRAEILTGPSRPALVVTIIMPLAPRAPYNTVADASFRIEKLSISSGCSLANASEVASKPSIRISGEVWYPKVVTPLIKNCALSAPGSPVVWKDIMPGIRPATELVRFEAGIRTSAARQAVTAPTTLDFFCVPKATTVTSSNWLSSVNIEICNTLRSSTTSVARCLPTKENTSVSPTVAWILNSPFAFVDVDVVLLPTATPTPTKSEPSPASRTTPDTVLD